MLLGQGALCIGIVISNRSVMVQLLHCLLAKVDGKVMLDRAFDVGGESRLDGIIEGEIVGGQRLPNRCDLVDSNRFGCKQGICIWRRSKRNESGLEFGLAHDFGICLGLFLLLLLIWNGRNEVGDEAELPRASFIYFCKDWLGREGGGGEGYESISESIVV